MVIAAPEPKVELQPVGEQRVVLRGLSWEAYLQILNALPQARGSRLTYDDGVLEITVPLATLRTISSGDDAVITKG